MEPNLNFKKSLLAVNIGLVMSAGFTGAAYAADETKVQEDVEVIEICVKAGDQVDSEDPIIVLESDKAAMEIDSDASARRF